MVVLTKSDDYTYGDIKFRKGVPTEVSAEVESYLLGTGYFEKAEKTVPTKAETKQVSKPAAKKPAAKVAIKNEDDTEE